MTELRIFQKLNALKKFYPFIKFLLTGGLNTVFGYVVYTVYVYFTEMPSLSLVLATITGVLFNFKTYGTFVFKSKDNSRFVRFCTAYAFLSLTQVVALKGLNVLGLIDPYLAGLVLTGPMAILSFVLIKRFVFQQSLFGAFHPEDGESKAVEQ